MNSWPRSEALREAVKFSAESIILRYTNKLERGFIYLITLRIIYQGERTSIIPVYFVDFFVSLGRIVNQAPVVQTMDSAVHWINHYPADKH